MSKVNGKRYSSEIKQALVKRMLPPENISPTFMSKETGIPVTTLYTWKKRALNNSSTPTKTPPNKWNTKEKFHVVLETFSLSEEEIASYCRRKGLYPEQIKLWQQQCMMANSSESKDPKILEDSLKQEKDRNKSLQKELNKKEKALTEAAALLVLGKKAQAIWGDNGDE